MSPKFGRAWLGGFVLSLLVLLIAQPAFADNVYATVRGTVTDSTGAILSGVKVTATNTQTNVTTSTTSNNSGLYEFTQLPVGSYSISASRQGFKTYKSTAFTLSVNQIYDLGISMQVGEVSETVEVKADAVQVETTSIQHQTVINSQEIVDLPLIGRNFVQLSQLSPGVSGTSDRFGTNYATNGAQSQQNTYLINGTDSADIALNTPGLIPSPDAIQEFNLVTSTINPEYGRNSGGILNALIKTGTNSFHGGAFDFYRDTFLNTRNFFTIGPQQPIFHQNVFGGTFGGPIFKDKTFFFLSYQGTYNTIGTPTVTTVFSQDQRNGNFAADSQLITAFIQGQRNSTPFDGIVGDDGMKHAAGTPWFGTGTSGAIFNCGNTPTQSNPTCSNPAFGNIGAGNFNSIASNLMNKFVPLPNGANNAFSFSSANAAKTDQGIVRVDHNFSSSDQIWATYIDNNNRGTQGLPFTGATLPGFGTFSTADTKEATLAYNHNFNPTTLNELRVGWYRLNFDTVEPSQTISPSSFGFAINPDNPKAAQLPVMAVTGLFTLGFSDNGPQPRKDQNYQVTDNFTKIIGKHTLKFGFDARRFQVDNPFNPRIDGHFDYAGAGGFSTGDPGVDFLLGIPHDYLQGSASVINARAYEYYGYGQDQWKIKNNLTLTFGAGYQVDTPYNNNQFGGEAFNCVEQGTQSTVFPTAPAGLLFPGDRFGDGGDCTRSGTTTKYGHLGPRAGFAWSPNLGRISGGTGKFSIRGGFGVYFNRYEEETALQNLDAPPFGITSAGAGDVPSPSNPNPPASGSPGFANPFADVTGVGSNPNKFPFTPPPLGSPVDFTFFEPFSINTNARNLNTPYSMNYNLTIEREFAGNTVMSVGYVGSQGRHLYRAYEADPITLAGAAACLTNTGAEAGCVGHRALQHLLFPQNSLFGTNAFGSVGTQFTDGTSHYSALQVNVTKGMSHGLSFITSYTWSHSIDNASGFESSGFHTRGTNTDFPFLNVGDSDFDARQRFVIGYVYAVPSLHKMANWAPDRVFGGWKLTGITTFQGGTPINLGDSTFRSLTCDAFVFYDCADNPNQVAAVTTLDPRASSKNFWFNPKDFTKQAIGSFGDVGRNSIHGPGTNNFDFSLQKDTKITERITFEMGLEGFNVFNHTQFCNGISGTAFVNPGGCITTNIASRNFGRVFQAGQGRLVQLRGKINF